jgi:hypothetical protein
VEASVGTATNMIVVQNWREELKPLVPVNWRWREPSPELRIPNDYSLYVAQGRV